MDLNLARPQRALTPLLEVLFQHLNAVGPTEQEKMDHAQTQAPSLWRDAGLEHPWALLLRLAAPLAPIPRQCCSLSPSSQ